MNKTNHHTFLRYNHQDARLCTTRNPTPQIKYKLHVPSHYKYQQPSTACHRVHNKSTCAYLGTNPNEGVDGDHGHIFVRFLCRKTHTHAASRKPHIEVWRRRVVAMCLFGFRRCWNRGICTNNWYRQFVLFRPRRCDVGVSVEVLICTNIL